MARPRIPFKLEERARTMWLDGHFSKKEISLALGISESTVRRRILIWGLPQEINSDPYNDRLYQNTQFNAVPITIESPNGIKVTLRSELEPEVLLKLIAAVVSTS